MLDLTNDNPQICVIGRCDFRSGIGSMTYSVLESIGRNYPVCILPTEPALRNDAHVYLPSERRVPVLRRPEDILVTIFCDVLWNGEHDFNFHLVPPQSLKIAYIVFDSDRLPDRWVSLLNQHFDLTVVTSPHLIETAVNSGVESPVACVPIALDVEKELAKPVRHRDSGVVRFGCVAAFHPRKGQAILTEAFRETFPDPLDAELVLHSNVSLGDTFSTVTALAAAAPGRNVHLSHGNLSADEKDGLIAGLDVFVNISRGEAYSIGPREALAAGKCLVLSDVGGHNDLRDIPGVFMVPADVVVPARYPEIDNLVFGQARLVRKPLVMDALRAAHAFVRSPDYRRTIADRRRCAGRFSFDALSTSFAALIDRHLPVFRKVRGTPVDVIVPDAFTRVVESRIGPRARRITATRRTVCAAYDAGFFSIYNAFASHLVWDSAEDRCHAVLPDWDVGRLLERVGGKPLTSFCYGKPTDGNVWLRLFEPLFGFSDAEMNDPEVLYERSTEPAARHNEKREPLMTYVHAYKLYKSREFAFWRRQYHRIIDAHVHLRPELSAEVARFAEQRFGGRLVVAAHVRHPSHAMEQPSAIISQADAYIDRVRQAVRARGIALDSDDWRVFLATDQERVTMQFEAAFGDRVAYYNDVRRTRVEEDKRFERLSAAERAAEGHQVQHMLAARPDAWSTRLAWEVIRDAYTMARCDALLHVVSNISTAVSYLNPDAEMIFCTA